MRPPLPYDEVERLSALRRLAVLDTPPDPVLDRVVALAADLMGVPIGLVSLIDEDRGWFKAKHGIDGVGTCRDLSFCSWTILDPEVTVVPDARLDPRFADNEMVSGEDAFIRSYVGAPLVTADGYAVGALCVVGPEPRTFTQVQVAGLADLASLVVEVLEAQELRLHYRSVCDAVGLVTFHADAAGRLLALSEPWEQLTGWAVMDSLGAPLLDLVVPALREATRAQLLFPRGGDDLVRVETRLQVTGGRELPVEVTVLVSGTADRSRGMLGTVSDISDRQLAAAESSHHQKLEALGRLAAGLAHEINTPIQFVGDNVVFLAEACSTLLGLVETYRGLLQDGTLGTGSAPLLARGQAAAELADLAWLQQEVPSAATQTLGGIQRVATIVHSMKSFSYKDSASPSLADVNAAVRSTATIARNETKYVADVQLELGELPLVSCFVGDLNQVFLNLLVNAADALRDTGRRGRILVSTRLEGDEVVVEVADDGPGVPSERRTQVFEPFFTTKQVGKGTGQGLALARSIVHDRHRGQLSLHETPGGGATFRLRLPVAGPHGAAA